MTEQQNVYTNICAIVYVYINIYVFICVYVYIYISFQHHGMKGISAMGANQPSTEFQLPHFLADTPALK